MPDYRPEFQTEPPTGPARYPVSATDPIDGAKEWTGRLLFPFDLSRWISFSVGLFLAVLSTGLINVNISPEVFQGGVQAIGAVVGMCFGIVIALLLGWVGAVGEFVFLEYTLTGETDLSSAWARGSAPGTSLFLLHLAAGFVGLVLMAPVSFIYAERMLAIMESVEQQGGQMEPQQVFAMLADLFTSSTPLVAAGCCFGFLAVAFNTISHDIVVPLMYRWRVSSFRAIGIAFRLMGSNVGVFIGYFAVRFCIGVLFWLTHMVYVLACCVAFCLPFIPVVGQVAILPLHMWRRTYTVLFLEQFGPEWEIFQRGPAPADPGPGGYMPPPAAPV
ncbi:MAG: hypothetical protein SF028_11380 [Candidatus Sumerlaeia bacterium]|nr:hypothetical protein [Candidatus Sumerlaeia bacterium]